MIHYSSNMSHAERIRIRRVIRDHPERLKGSGVYASLSGAALEHNGETYEILWSFEELYEIKKRNTNET